MQEALTTEYLVKVFKESLQNLVNEVTERISRVKEKRG